MSKQSYLNPLVLAFFMTLPSLADEVYRTVDEMGHVIFTDAPPADASRVERVELPPGPSAASIKSTESRNKAIRAHLKDLQNQRSRNDAQRKQGILQAEKALAEAQARLETAKVLKDTDRQSLAGGKSRIHPDYFERIKKAEEAVEKAKNNLEKVRSGN
jgi:hypothetical protein